MQRLAMVAGETSGDMLAAHVLGGLRQRSPNLQAVGIGGPRMAEHGFDAWWPSDKLAVRGYVEVLKRYREIVGIRKALACRLLAAPKADHPEVFVGVDAPDFNLDLELKLRQNGIKTAHFISPSIWAWRPERIEKVRTACDAMLCVFPFEPEIYAQAGIRAHYVGHPLATVIPQQVDTMAAKAALGWSKDDPVLAILPGSRQSEVEYLALRQFKALVAVFIESVAIKCVVPCVPELMSRIEQLARLAGLGEHLGTRLKLLKGQSHQALAACDVTLIASGTATLEAALYKKPMVVVYNMHAISWWLTQRKRLQPWVSLPNILLKRFAVPELLQHEASPQAMASEVLHWFNHPQKRADVAEQFAGLHHALKRNTVALACDAIEALAR